MSKISIAEFVTIMMPRIVPILCKAALTTLYILLGISAARSLKSDTENRVLHTATSLFGFGMAAAFFVCK